MTKQTAGMVLRELYKTMKSKDLEDLEQAFSIDWANAKETMKFCDLRLRAIRREFTRRERMQGKL